MTEKKTRKIVRLLSTDLDGSLSVGRALRRIKGISFMFSKAVCIVTNIDINKEIGELSEEEIKKLEDTIKEPKMPDWLLNRKNDPETGTNAQIIGAKLDLRKREDINLLKRIRSYRGIRHEQGQPTRGQRTRGTFRTQKSVGVTKKSAIARTAPKGEKK